MMFIHIKSRFLLHLYMYVCMYESRKKYEGAEDRSP